MKKILVAILNKLSAKISGLEEYNQQLIKIEKSITELRDLLASEKGKDARTICDLLSKSSKEDLEKIIILIETTRSIRDKDVSAIFDFINKSSKEDIEKIMTLAETTKDFKEKDVKAISKFINQISKEDLGMIAENIKAIQEKDARAIFEFLSKAPKKKLEKMAILAGTARLVQELDKIEIPTESVIKFDKYIDYIKVAEIRRRLEDIEYHSYLGETYLSSMDTEIEESLNKGIIPEKLKNGLETKEFLLPENSIIRKEDDKWVITDKEKKETYCVVRKGDNRLDIYVPSEGMAKFGKKIEKMGLFAGIARVAAQLEPFGPGDRPLEPGYKGIPVDEMGLEPGYKGIPVDEMGLEPGYKGIPVDEMGLEPGYKGIAVDEMGLKPGERIRTLEGEERVIPEEVIRLYQKGIKLLSEWKNLEAHDLFDKIISDNPDLKLKGAWLNKGVAAGRLGHKQEEINCYNEALEIDKNYTAALRNLVTAGMGI